MRLTLIILLAIAMTGCASSDQWKRNLVAIDNSVRQYQTEHPIAYSQPTKVQDEPHPMTCTQTQQFGGLSQKLDCH